MMMSAATQADPVWNNAAVPYSTAVTRDTAGILFAGGMLGISKSTDNGTTWQLINGDPDMHGAFAMTVNPVTNAVFAAVEPGVFRSSDGGATWDTLASSIVGAYALGARSDGLLIAAGSIGICRSTDNGNSWIKTSTTPGPLHNGIAFSQSGAVFVVSLLNGLYRSTDDGVTWQHVSSSFGAADNVQDVVTDSTNGFVYATSFHMFFNDPTYNKVFRSPDDGATWTQVDSVSGISLSLGVNALGHVFSGRTPTTYSTDHGATWIDIPGGIQQGDRLVEFLAAGNGRMFVADMDDSLKFADFGAPLVCGDADGSGAISISDAVFLISYIFAGGPAPDPVASGDADNSGALSISDAVYLINYIFAGGSAPCANL